MDELQKLPVTIITGFLGSGKTTLLNHIIKKHKEKRFVILENEYGEENIDGSLIKKELDNKLFELSNGCICCTLNDDLGAVLMEILRSRTSFDHLIIEATGIANPADIIRNFVVGDILPEKFEIDSVICLLDAKWFLRQFEDHHELRKQVVQSDTVLINKSDLASANTIHDISALVKEINPFANIHLAKFGISKQLELLDTKAYQAPNVEKNLIDFKNTIPDLFGRKDSAHHIKSLTFTLEGSVVMDKFTEWMDRYMYVNTGKLYRIKGILNLSSVDYKVVLQSVYDHCNFQRGSLWRNGEMRKSTLVFIGTGLYEKELRERLKEFFTKID